MAKFELNIYGEADAIVKEYKTNICPWAVFIQAADMQEELEEKSPAEQMAAVGELLKSVFHGLTDAELSAADGFDVMNTFNQIVHGGQKIKGKNVQRAGG